MANNEYVHMRYKNGAIACFERTEGEVKTSAAKAQLDRHGDSAEIWLYRTRNNDWHRFQVPEGKSSSQWVNYPESKVPATVIQYVKLTAE